MKNLIKTVLLSSIVAVFFSACKKSEDSTPAPSSKNLSLQMNAKVGSKTLSYSDSLLTEDGQKYALSDFRYYVSGIKLIKKDGNVVPITGKYLYVTPSSPAFDLGTVPSGEYDGIKFTIGIDSVTNHSDHTLYPADHPLGPKTPSIYWSWKTGYIFMRIDGSFDATATKSDRLIAGSYAKPMFYHIGTNPLKREVSLDTDFKLTDSNASTLQIDADVNKFFIGINMKTENATHTTGSVPLATKCADNFNKMFTLKP